MACRFRIFLVSAFLCLILTGCISFRIAKVIDGRTLPYAEDKLQIGRTTISDVLSLYGAPQDVVAMKGKTLLIYERNSYRGGQLTFGVPLSDTTGLNINLSSYGDLIRYDTLALFFTLEDRLAHVVFTRGTDRPLWGSLWQD